MSINRIFSWGSHLKVRRGGRIFIHALRMFRLHTTPFHFLLQRMFDLLDEYNAKFTFPLIASILNSNPDLVRFILSYPHEIAIHGFKHVRYQYLSYNQQSIEFQNAIKNFKKFKIPFNGFRAPYNNYTEDTLKLIEHYGFKWDGGIGFRLEYRNKNKFFNISLNGKKSSFICIPLCEWSDDRMIDNYGLNSSQMAKIMIYYLEKARKKNGLIMFDLHPIRIGQEKYIDSLKQLLEYAQTISAWTPTVTEAIDYWSKHKKWKDNAPVCCILTGDIDNFNFFDYLRRF